PGGAVGGALEAHVAFAASTAVGRDHAIARARQVLDYVPLLGVDDQGAGGHLDDQVLGIAAMAAGTAAAFAVGGLPVALAREGGQAIDAGRGHEDHAAAVAAVAAVRTTAGHVLLPAKAQAAIATAPGLDLDGNRIDKHR